MAYISSVVALISGTLKIWHQQIIQSTMSCLSFLQPLPEPHPPPPVRLRLFIATDNWVCDLWNMPRLSSTSYSNIPSSSLPSPFRSNVDRAPTPGGMYNGYPINNIINVPLVAAFSSLRRKYSSVGLVGTLRTISSQPLAKRLLYPPPHCGFLIPSRFRYQPRAIICQMWPIFKCMVMKACNTTASCTGVCRRVGDITWTTVVEYFPKSASIRRFISPKTLLHRDHQENSIQSQVTLECTGYRGKRQQKSQLLPPPSNKCNHSQHAPKLTTSMTQITTSFSNPNVSPLHQTHNRDGDGKSEWHYNGMSRVFDDHDHTN